MVNCLLNASFEGGFTFLGDSFAWFNFFLIILQWWQPPVSNVRTTNILVKALILSFIASFCSEEQMEVLRLVGTCLKQGQTQIFSPAYMNFGGSKSNTLNNIQLPFNARKLSIGLWENLLFQSHQTCVLTMMAVESSSCIHESLFHSNWHGFNLM